MNLTYHVLMAPGRLPVPADWEKACRENGFDLSFDAAGLALPLSSQPRTITVTYRGATSSCKACTARMSDVADICDELRSHIGEDQTLSVDLAFQDDQSLLPGISVIVGVLAKMTDGVVYTEGDGTFANGDEALEIAKGW